MTGRLHQERDLDQHLRRTLAAVAATVREDPADDSAPLPLRPRRHRRLLLGTGVTIAAIPLAAAAMVRFGPEYVDRIPPEDPILSGTLDGERYWVVDGREVPRCEGSPTGVELIVEQHNVVGQEWNTVGAFFGEPTGNGCAPRLPANTPAYSYASDGGLMVGDGMLWMGALHPDVDQVRVTLGDGEAFDATPFQHEGGRYYLLEVPPGTATFTVDYLVGGEVVPPPSGESAEHLVPSN
jgi:hypothetical protein